MALGPLCTVAVRSCTYSKQNTSTFSFNLLQQLIRMYVKLSLTDSTRYHVSRMRCVAIDLAKPRPKRACTTWAIACCHGEEYNKAGGRRCAIVDGRNQKTRAKSCHVEATRARASPLAKDGRELCSFWPQHYANATYLVSMLPRPGIIRGEASVKLEMGLRLS